MHGYDKLKPYGFFIHVIFKLRLLCCPVTNIEFRHSRAKWDFIYNSRAGTAATQPGPYMG